MRLVFAGTPEVAVPSLDALVASSHEVVAVITRPDAGAGRGRKLTPSPVAIRAEELGLEVLKPTHPKDPEFLQRLREIAPDACPVVAYGALLPQAALDIPSHGWINLHFSLLPRWRGAAPVQRAIMAGDEQIGTACFQIVRELDAGDVYLLDAQPMPEATAGEVLEALAASGAQQLVRAIDLVAAGERPTPQPSEGVTTAAKITVDDARIDWTRPAQEVRNLIMGCSPTQGHGVSWAAAGSRSTAPPSWPTRGSSRGPCGSRNATRTSAAGTQLWNCLRCNQQASAGWRPSTGRATRPPARCWHEPPQGRL